MSLSLPTRPTVPVPAPTEPAQADTVRTTLPRPVSEATTDRLPRITAQPVFVDGTGRRIRRLRRAGALVLTAASHSHDGERLRDVWLVPLQQIVYRQLMYLVLIESVLTAVAGVPPALAQAAPHGRAAERAGRRDGDPLLLSRARGQPTLTAYTMMLSR